MHPNVFLRTFWRTELKPQVFVAVSFAEAYRKRYENVIAPKPKAPKGTRKKD